MKTEMCAQLEILEKIRKKGKVNGYDVDLAEAQAKDYMAMKHRLDNIESDVSSIKTEQTRQGEIQAEQGRMISEQGGMIKAIFNQINAPLEQEKIQIAYWRAFQTIAKSPKTWIFVIILIFLIAMTGQEIKQLLGWVPAVVG